MTIQPEEFLVDDKHSRIPLNILHSKCLILNVHHEYMSNETFETVEFSTQWKRNLKSTKYA